MHVENFITFVTLSVTLILSHTATYHKIDLLNQYQEVARMPEAHKRSHCAAWMNWT